MEPFQSISVWVQRGDYNRPMLSRPQHMMLEDKMRDYLELIDPIYVLPVTVELLTCGKVRVDFTDYFERIELQDRSAVMDMTQATAYFEATLKRIRSSAPATGESEAAGLSTTQAIVIENTPPPAN